MVALLMVYSLLRITLSLSERLFLMMAVRQLSASGDYILTYEGLNAARKLAGDYQLSASRQRSTAFL